MEKDKTKNITDIIKEYLEKNNYDGLCNDGLYCGCGLDELCRYGCISPHCIPAYKIKCEKCDNYWFEAEKRIVVCDDCQND